ncbi:MAG: hypothetical protein AB8G23_06950 [Myxococcota bacterium]
MKTVGRPLNGRKDAPALSLDSALTFWLDSIARLLVLDRHTVRPAWSIELACAGKTSAAQLMS